MKKYLALGLAAAAAAASAGAYDWTQFNGDARHSGDNTRETVIDASNVARLVPVFQATLPAVCDGAPLVLPRVGTPSGVRDLLFAETRAGDLVALDASTGATVWTRSNPAGGCRINNGSNVCYTTSSPAVDPNRVFVYAYGLDGRVHRYRVGDGQEVTGEGWPQVATLKPFDEKGSSDLTVAVNAFGTPFLYVCNGGYPGDQGDYQGHVTSVNLSTGAQAVFNAACSDHAVHFVEKPGSPDCAHVQTAIWARSGAVYDRATNRLFVATGNGDYDGNASGHDWGDSVLAIHPNGTGAAGNPVDSYTPTNFQQLEDADADLGSTAPAILPAPGYAGRLGLQSGKDGILRLLRLDDLSGHGGPGFTGGAVQTLGVPQGGAVFSAPAVWVNPSDGTTWTFVGNGAGLSALRLSVSGVSATLAGMWTKATASFSPLVAGGILYAASGGSVRALSPTTGASLWSDASSVGGIHWQSPVVANGVLYLADESRHLTAWAPALTPVAATADGEAVSGSSSNVDGLMEPGETAELAPVWKNFGSGAAAVSGTLAALTGPPGASYGIGDASASYTLAAGSSGSCRGTAQGCYRVSVSDPSPRPAAHWDAVATETLSDGSTHRWTIHVGGSFADVAASETFAPMIETLFHRGATLGCTTTQYCPQGLVTRGQIAAFVARIELGGDSAVPVTGLVAGVGRYACGKGGVSLFSDVSPTDPFCGAIHWLVAAGRSFRCDEQAAPGTTWCPASAITRGSFARILARGLTSGDAAVPNVHSDARTGRSYDCGDGKANAFSDVTDASPLCRFVYFIWAKGVVDGFPDGTYHPSAPVPRDQMAKFLVNAYGLTLD